MAVTQPVEQLLPDTVPSQVRNCTKGSAAPRLRPILSGSAWVFQLLVLRDHSRLSLAMPQPTGRPCNRSEADVVPRMLFVPLRSRLLLNAATQ